MADFYEKMAAVAEKQITKRGRSISVVKISRTPTDASKPWRADDTPREDTDLEDSILTMGAFVEPSSLVHFGFTSEDSELVKRSKQVVLIAGKSVNQADIDQYDEIWDGATIWKIDRTIRLKPGPVTLLYVVGLSQ